MSRGAQTGVVLAAVAVAALQMGCGGRGAGARSVGAGEGPSRYGQEGLRVSGTAVLRVAPDVAVVRLGYESRGRVAHQAKLDNDRVMRKVLAAIVKAGVAGKDTQTAEYRLFPVWESWPIPTTKTLFWHVLNMVEVQVRKVGTVAEVIDAACAAGADKVSDVRFTVEGIHLRRAVAREMAAKVAREKAEQLARLMGAKLGKVVSISDAPASSWYGPAQSVANTVAEAQGNESVPEAVVRGGQVEIQAMEEVVFALE